jgi:hypothetical protein
MTSCGSWTARLSRWLGRYEPRKHLRGKDALLADELNALLAPILKYAPPQAYEPWTEVMLERLDERMTTTAWPIAGEVAAACTAPSEPAEPRGNVVPFPKPVANPVALSIDNGTVRDERHARWQGMTLTGAQLARARAQRPCREEWDHHVRVMARFSRFQGLTLADVEAICAAEMSSGQLPVHLAHLGRREPERLAMPQPEPRRLAPAIARPRTPADHLDPVTQDPLAPRAYSLEELARIRRNHGLALPPEDFDLVPDPYPEAQGGYP